MSQTKRLSEILRTERGFQFIEFQDSRSQMCSLQQSSAIDDTERGMNQPGSSFVWLGCGDQRMHLSREQVEALVVELHAWLSTGEFAQ